MCGISGLVSERSGLVTEGVLERMTGVLRHRGPDDAGIELRRDDFVTAGLGHRRLSIIDLSPAGHQPMCNEDRSIWLTYNGEIYNHLDLRAELLAAGHTYGSRTDSETVLHAYEQWGERCVERFRGMFAFGIWDAPRRRLLLGRDRLGVKPLYYAELPGTILFASEIKALLESGLVDAAPARGAIPEYLAFGYLAGADTMFRGIRKLMPGHVLVWADGRSRVEQYWDVTFDGRSEQSDGELEDEFRTRFEESVQVRLMSDVPLGVFLSGGLDSSAIAAVAARHVDGPLMTFSVGYERQYYSEFDYAREVAAHIGADHHEIVLTPAGFLTSLPKMIWHEDEPLWGPPSVALYHVSKLASNHVKVVLTGEGSDELFAGYDRYWMSAWNVAMARVLAKAPAALRSALRAVVLRGPLPERVARAFSHTALTHDAAPEHLLFDNWFGVFTPDMQRRLLADPLRQEFERTDVYAAHLELYERAVSPDVVNRMLYVDLRSNLVELLMKQDQMSMATSIESRVPFLDHHLVEFAGRVPVRQKVNGRSGKWIVKRALASYLPERVLRRPKEGFPLPFDTWLRAQFFDETAALLLDRRALDRGWFRPEAVRQLLEDHREGRANGTRRIWNLLGLELWARLFLDGERLWREDPIEAWQRTADVRQAVACM